MGHIPGKPEAELRQYPDASGHAGQPSNNLELPKRFLQGLWDDGHKSAALETNLGARSGLVSEGNALRMPPTAMYAATTAPSGLRDMLCTVICSGIVFAEPLA